MGNGWIDVKLLSLALCTILIGGCVSAPLTEEEHYDRDDREILRLERFYRDEKACKDAGGVMVIKRWGPTIRRKQAPPRRWDDYGCLRGGLF